MPMHDDPGASARALSPLVEAQHRMRNTMAVVRSLVRRTAQSAQTVEEFEQHLDGRLAAFARIQSYLIRDPSSKIDLELLVRDELLTHALNRSDHVTIDGPALRLPGRIAETLTLAIHELLTNAVKFGALEDDQGAIAIRWDIEDSASPIVTFSWHEHSSTAQFDPPSKRGFGFEFLEETMRYELDADPMLTVSPESVQYIVRFPISD